MELLFIILLVVGFMMIMNRGHGGMGCCGGGHGDHKPKGNNDKFSGDSSFDPTRQVIDLREDEYAVLSDQGEDFPRIRGGNSGKKKI